MVSSIVYNGDGTTRIFPVDFKILGENFVRVYVDDVEITDKRKYDIINNSIVFNEEETPQIGEGNVVIIVATSESELGDLGAPITDIMIVANNIEAINSVGQQVVPNLAEILQADDNAAIATQKALEASNSATSASGSATTATTQAGIATAQSNIATTKAGEASASEANTLAYRNTTLGYRNEAEVFKNQADASATTATTQANRAKSEADRAEGYAGVIDPATYYTKGEADALLSVKQNTITGGASTITTANLTASRALVSDANGKVAVSGVTSTQLGYLSGATSNIQEQINALATTGGGVSSAFKHSQKYTSSGTFTVPANVTRVFVMMASGGGGGGGGRKGDGTTSGTSGGGGGGSNWSVPILVDVTPNSTIPVVVGAGGAGGAGDTSTWGGGAGSNGGAGGVSSFNGLTVDVPSISGNFGRGSSIAGATGGGGASYSFDGGAAGSPGSGLSAGRGTSSGSIIAAQAGGVGTQANGDNGMATTASNYSNGGRGGNGANGAVIVYW